MPAKSSPETIEIGRRIREARLAGGISVRQLARMLSDGNEKRNDTYRRYLIRWEAGRNRPDETNRNRIADLLGIPRSTFSADAVDTTPYDTLLRSLRSVVDHELRVRLDPLRETIEDLQRADVLEDLSDALAYVYGRVLIAIDLWQQDARREAIGHLRRAEQRLASAIEAARGVAA